MRGVNNKSGQMKISFGMIFSLILIIVFLAFAFFGIKKFLSVQNEVKVGQFKESLQEDIDRVWNGPQGQQQNSYSLPSKINEICFRNTDIDNLYFTPRGDFNIYTINHINKDETFLGRSEKCFENDNGEVVIAVKKDFGDSLVTLI